MGKQLVLVETKTVRMVNLLDEGEPTRRKGHFLKPVGRFSDETKGVASPYLARCCPLPAHFMGWYYPPKRWSAWVHKMEDIYAKAWDAAGIRGAIKATTCKVARRLDLIWELAARWWCPQTNTFVFPWAEATLTLEDVAVLGGFSLLGEPATVMLPLAEEDATMHKRMVREANRFRTGASKNPLQSRWLRHYYVDERKMAGDEDVEHVAFLCLWLSRFVFPGPVKDAIRQQVFPLAIRLARGCRIALAPAVLAALYSGLRELKRHASMVAGASSSTDGAIWAPFQLLQLWVWERFPLLRPNTRPRTIQTHGPWAATWHNLQKADAATPSMMSSLVDAGRQFRWRPYLADFDGWVRAPFYGGTGRWVDGCSEEGEGMVAFSRCLATCELVGLDSIEQYLPHRVSMQLGFDQDIPAAVRRANSSRELAWSTYDRPTEKVRFYVPARCHKPRVTLQFRRWWELNMAPLSGKGCSEEQQQRRVHVLDAQNQVQEGLETEGDLEVTASMEKEREGLDSMPLSSWLGVKGRRGKRKRKTVAELEQTVVTSPVEHKVTSSCPTTGELLESPTLLKSLSSATKQDAKDAGEVEDTKASVRPGESSCNPIIIDDTEVKVEEEEVGARRGLDMGEIGSQIDRLSGELARLRAMIGLKPNMG